MRHEQPFVPGYRAAAALLVALVCLVLVFQPGPAHAAVGGPSGGPTSSPSGGPSGSPSGTGTVKDGNGSLIFGMGPANHVPANQIVDGRAYLVYAADAGATILDRVAIFNYFATPLRVQVYATDAVQSADGGFGLLTGDQTPSDAGSWIKVLGLPKSGFVTIPARTGNAPYGVTYVRFIAKIPPGTTPGDHVGGLVASLKSTSTNKQGAKITLDQRIGLRAYFTLAGRFTPTVAVEDLRASYQNQWDPAGRGLYTVTYYLHNTGNIRLHVDQTVTVSRCIVIGLLCPVGSLVGHPPAQAELLPGTRLKVTQTFHRKFGLGHLTALVTLHATSLDRAFKGTIADVSASAGFWALPWLLIIIVIGVLLLFGGLVWRFVRRRRRRKRELELAASLPQPKHAAPVAEQKAPGRLTRAVSRPNPTIRTTRTQGRI